MPQIKSIGKYLDQPLLTAKINKKVPLFLAIGSGAVLFNNINNAPKNKKKKAGLKTATILFSTAISAVIAPKIATYITGRKMTKKVNEIKDYNTKLIDNYIEKNNLDKDLIKILERAKTKILSLKEVKTLFNNEHLKPLSNKLIPPPENINAKDIFKEIGWLSIYGAVPVLGGISGGIIADKMTEKKWKKKVPDKLNEGIYQYLANIFMCNVGAGVALGLLEKSKIKSKTARCIGMTAGIIATGVIGGSMIANFIGNNLINPLLGKKNKTEVRTPELIDISLHTDDIATVSLLSGLKWIEPCLPLLYSISGYRAGVGYRNHKDSSKDTKEKFLREKC